MKKSLLTSLISAAALSACTLAPVYERPQVNTAEQARAIGGGGTVGFVEILRHGADPAGPAEPARSYQRPSSASGEACRRPDPADLDAVPVLQ